MAGSRPALRAASSIAAWALAASPGARKCPPRLGSQLFGQGYSLAAVIANEFGEAQGLHRSALFAAGLVLFVLTLLVNLVARRYVVAASRPGGGGRRRFGGRDDEAGVDDVPATAVLGA